MAHEQVVHIHASPIGPRLQHRVRKDCPDSLHLHSYRNAALFSILRITNRLGILLLRIFSHREAVRNLQITTVCRVVPHFKGRVMPPNSTIDRQVLEIIIRSPGATLDDVVLQCQNLTWNQVFLAIDRLSREGAVTLSPKGHGLYSVQVSDQISLRAQSRTAA